MIKLKISLIKVSYNDSRFFEEVTNNILKQPFENFEIQYFKFKERRYNNQL